MRVLLFIAVLTALLWQAPCRADDLLQGRIEQRNALTRVTRPAMPSRPSGDALDHVDPSAGHSRKAEFDLAASSVSNLLDKRAFDFNYHGGGGRYDNSDESDRPLRAGAEAGDKDLIIAWEEWHRRLCAAIYHNWQIFGNVPGEGIVVLHVTREGDLDFEMKGFKVGLYEQCFPCQREKFEQRVGSTLRLIDHTFVLNFPERSQRKEVTLGTRFKFSEQGEGPNGYTWKHGDYERITESH
jgi:hypothetical protein